LYPEWKCITHPIELTFYKRENTQKWEVVFSFDVYEDNRDELLEHFFMFDLDDVYANVDNIYENGKIPSKLKYLDVLSARYSCKDCKARCCNLFIWYKPCKKAPPNDAKFYAIQHRIRRFKKVQKYEVINDYVYFINSDDDDDYTRLFHRDEWERFWKEDYPVFLFITIDIVNK
jgi:hypothetical protein